MEGNFLPSINTIFFLTISYNFEKYVLPIPPFYLFSILLISISMVLQNKSLLYIIPFIIIADCEVWYCSLCIIERSKDDIFSNSILPISLNHDVVPIVMSWAKSNPTPPSLVGKGSTDLLPKIGNASGTPGTLSHREKNWDFFLFLCYVVEETDTRWRFMRDACTQSLT